MKPRLNAIRQPIPRRRWAVVGLTGLFLACGGGSPTPAVLSVGGTYQTLVSLLPGNTCTNVTVQNNPTMVMHMPGSQSLSLTHASITYQGTISSSAAFSTTPNTISSGGSQLTITIGGQFSLTGFDATVNVNVTQPPPACAYMVHWMGTKDGAPNTIP